MMSKPLAPPLEVEWTWMVVPSLGMLAPPTLVFGPPLAVVLALAAAPAPVAILASMVALAPAMVPAQVVIPALAVHVVEVGSGSRRCRRSLARRRWRSPRRSPP